MPVARRTLFSLIVIAYVAMVPIAARADEILVFAAASLTDALREIGQEFHKDSGNDVTCSFGASSMLARQIIEGAPADIFFAADLAKMEQLENAGLVYKKDVRNLLSNQLVVIVPADSKAKVAAPADLENFSAIVTGDPKSVPVGVYARKWLESIGLWKRLEPKIIPTLDVRAAMAAVETGAAEAGFVYKTDATSSPRVQVVYAVIDGPPITYPVARLIRSKKPAARSFVDYLGGAKARAVFTRMGFILM
jgi:molybdate transport system substrate-binding protein